jgi:hypothetical protein
LTRIMLEYQRKNRFRSALFDTAFSRRQSSR